MGPIQSFDDLVDAILRRLPLILAIVVPGILLSVIVGSIQPSSYQASAVIQIDTPIVDGAAPTQGANRTAQALQLIEQRLTTRENLIAMIERHDLFSEGAMPVDLKVNALRNAISFQSVASASQQAMGMSDGISALIITAQLLDPEKTARVANDLAQSLLDQGTEGRAERTRATMSFYRDEVQRISADIVTLEAEITDYKNRNIDALPESTDSQRNDISSLDEEIRGLDQAILEQESERTVLEAAAPLRAIQQRQLEALTSRIAVLRAQKASLEGQRTQLVGAMDRNPEIARELGAYDRQMRQLQDQFEVSSARLAEAETNQKLEVRNQTERFTFLERAVVPDIPTGGGGKKIMFVGIVGSLALAGLLVMVLEVMNPVLRTSRQMVRELDIQPVVTIPSMRLGRPPVRRGTPTAVRLVSLSALFVVVMLAAALT